MELSQAKKFIYRDYDHNFMYISKDFWKLMELSNNTIDFILAVCNTPTGEQLFEIDEAYDGDFIICKIFMHVDSFMKFYFDWIIKYI